MSTNPTLSAALNDLFPNTNISLHGTLEIQYPTFIVSSGAEYPRDATQDEPTVTFSDAEPGAKYTLILCDPDLTKKNDASGQVRHWLQPGLQFAGPGAVGETAEPATTVHVGPAPGPGTGNHRYVFILGKEPGAAADAQLAAKYTAGGPQATLEDRMGFNVAQYVRGAGLEVVGASVMVVGATVG